jgi:two-component system, cell cycle response regulator DivK
MKVLVVEDTNDTRHMIRSLLRMKGHDVVEAINGLEAFNVARKEKPDLILMDLNMPVLDGFSSVRIIRVQEETAHIPIVAISAYLDSKEWKDKAIEAGCSETMTKPVDFKAFDNLLNKYSTGKNESSDPKP